MLTPTKRQSWHFKRGILKERDLLKKRQSAKLILVPGHCSFRGVNCSKNGCNREIFSFNVMVYFLSVQQFFTCRGILIVTTHPYWHFSIALPILSSLNFDDESTNSNMGGVCRLCIWICTFKIAFLFFPIDLTIQISTNTFFEYPLS